jgi:hypothetical protein
LCFSLKCLLSLFSYVMIVVFLNIYIRSLLWLSYDVSLLFVHTLIFFFSSFFYFLIFVAPQPIIYVELYCALVFFLHCWSSFHYWMFCLHEPCHSTFLSFYHVHIHTNELSCKYNFIHYRLHEWNIRKSCNHDGMCVINLNC